MTQKETDKIFNVITSNGCREMDEVRFNQAVNEIIERKAKKIKVDYSDGNDYSELEPTGIINTGSTGCPMCSEEENITITDDADICHECGYVYT